MTTIDLRYSNDGGHNYSAWRELSSGETGDFNKPLIARRLGQCTHRIWEFRDASNVAADILGCQIMVETE